MIKLIIFDLDGVLVEAKKIHYECLNQALREESDEYVIKWDEHLTIYDGLKTNQKLELLSINKGLPYNSYNRVWEKKQVLTLQSIEKLKPIGHIKDCISNLSQEGYKIVCCSNSIRKTVLTVLSKLDIIQYFDIYTKKAASILNVPIEKIRTDVVKDSRRYKGMRFFYAHCETAPENAFIISGNGYWTMMKWLND